MVKKGEGDKQQVTTYQITVNVGEQETVVTTEKSSGPNILIIMQELNAETLGQLIYFFELACAMSGSILGVNPFNQPGVEKYKKNMFRLLGKPTKK